MAKRTIDTSKVTAVSRVPGTAVYLARHNFMLRDVYHDGREGAVRRGDCVTISRADRQQFGPLLSEGEVAKAKE